MKRKYHEWTGSELAVVREYIRKATHPLSLYGLHWLAQDIGVSEGAVRGATERALRRMRSDVNKSVE